MKTVELSSVAATPWKNGGGVTRELLAWPDAADWRVRISLADVDRAGPFSAFPGVERWFAVVSGEGVRLRIEAAEHALHASSPPLRFDGAAAVGCELLGGATRDLNLMVRGGGGRMQRGPATLQGSRGSLVAIYTPGRLEWQILERDERIDVTSADAIAMEVKL